MKRALVTGASGFIGGHLVAALRRDGISVRGLVREASQARLPDGVERAIGDIRDPAAVRAASGGCDVVFHLAAAAPEGADVEQESFVCRQVNVEGTRNLVKAAAEAGVQRLIFFSTVKTMGESTQGVADESTEARPADAYARTKLEAEGIVLEGAGAGGVESVCLRPVLVYGPGQKGNMARLVSSIERGLFPPLPQGTGRRSLVHVASLVEAARLAAVRPEARGQLYIVADLALSARELQTAVARALGRTPPRRGLPLSFFRAAAFLGDALVGLGVTSFPLDSARLEKLVAPAEYSAERIRRELGWRPLLDLDAALAEIVAGQPESAR